MERDESPKRRKKEEDEFIIWFEKKIERRIEISWLQKYSILGLGVSQNVSQSVIFHYLYLKLTPFIANEIINYYLAVNGWLGVVHSRHYYPSMRYKKENKILVHEYVCEDDYPEYSCIDYEGCIYFYTMETCQKTPYELLENEILKSTFLHEYDCKSIGDSISITHMEYMFTVIKILCSYRRIFMVYET